MVGVSERVLSIHTDMGMFCGDADRIVIRNASTEPPREPYPRPVCTTEVTFGFIGRLTEEKGIDNLMRALAILPRDRIRMMIAGRVSDEEQRRLRALAPERAHRVHGLRGAGRLLQAGGRGDRPDRSGTTPARSSSPMPRRPAGRCWNALRRHAQVIEHGVTGWLTEADPQSLAKSMLAVAADPHKIDEISRRLIADTNKWIFSDVLSSYRTCMSNCATQRMSRMRAVTSGAPQGRTVGKERLIPR